MNCLQCGSAIGLVRKLKDAEFCCNEHRQEWADARERVLVDRLTEARIRIERARDRFLARKRVPEQPPEPTAAPYLTNEVPFSAGILAPAAVGAQSLGGLGVRMPVLSLPLRSRKEIAGPQPDLPWPAWNAGLRTFGELGLAELACSRELDYVRSVARVLGGWKAGVRMAQLPVAPLHYMRRPDIAGRRPVPRASSLSLRHPKPVLPNSTLPLLCPQPNGSLPA